MAAVVCCGSIYDSCALFFTVTQPSELSSTSGVLDHSTGGGGSALNPAGAPTVSGSAGGSTSSMAASGVSSNTLAVPSVGAGGQSSSGGGDEGGLASLSSASGVLMTTSLILPNPTPASSSTTANPAPGYLFHWIMGLLMCRDSKLILSPGLWGLPVIYFGVASTALKGAYGKTGVGAIRIEDQLRSIAISAAGGCRLDSVNLSHKYKFTFNFFVPPLIIHCYYLK